MREPQPHWVAALRALTGVDSDTIRFNEAVGRWEFIMAGAHGQPISQFWGQFHDPVTGRRQAPDPVTGLYPFRELDEAGMREALANLERTFVGNRFDGAGTPRKQAVQRMRQNRALRSARFRAAAEAFTDMAAERGKRLRGAIQIAPGTRDRPSPRTP